MYVEEVDAGDGSLWSGRHFLTLCIIPTNTITCTYPQDLMHGLMWHDAAVWTHISLGLYCTWNAGDMLINAPLRHSQADHLPLPLTMHVWCIPCQYLWWCLTQAGHCVGDMVYCGSEVHNLIMCRVSFEPTQISASSEHLENFSRKHHLCGNGRTWLLDSMINSGTFLSPVLCLEYKYIPKQSWRKGYFNAPQPSSAFRWCSAE